MAGARAANADSICSTDAIPTVTVHMALAQGPLRVPLLQRRYCWPERQLRKFLSDTIRLAKVDGGETVGEAARRDPGPLLGTGHSLGRVVVAQPAAGAAGVLVLDGQQRLTTAVLLLAAIRDVVAAAVAEAPDEVPAAPALLVDLGEAIGAAAGGTAVLVPTFFDRQAYAAAVAGEAAAGMPAAAGDAITVAVQYFGETLQQTGLRRVCDKLGLEPYDGRPGPLTPALVVAAAMALAKAVLTGFRMLWFHAREADVWSVYERLAFREFMLGKMLTNGTPGIPLAEADLTRNYLISFFGPEERQLEVYTAHWLRTETAAIDAAAALSAEARPLLDVLCDRFLAAQPTVEAAPEEAAGPAAHLGMGAFATYRGMRRLVEARLTAAGVAVVLAEPSEAAAAVVEQVLTDLATFATETPWAAQAAEAAAVSPGEPGAAAGAAGPKGGRSSITVGPNTNKFHTTVPPWKR